MVRSTGEDGESVQRFDAVAASSGLHQHPHVPDIEGFDNFTGSSSMQRLIAAPPRSKADGF